MKHTLIVTPSGEGMVLISKADFDQIEDRLDVLTGRAATPAKDAAGPESSILAHPLDDTRSIVDAFAERFGNMRLLFEQADTSLTVAKLAVISLAPSRLELRLRTPPEV